MPSSSTDPRPRPRNLFLLSAIVALAVGLLGAALYLNRSLRQEARRNAGAELEAVVSLKVAAVVAWRDQQVETARYAAGYPTVRALPGTLREPALHAGLATHAREILSRLAEREHYLSMAVIAADGRPLVEWHRAGASALPFDAALLAQALASGEPVTRIDVLPTRPAGPWLDLVVPVPAEGDGRPSAVLALRVDLAPALPSLVHGWPVPSATAATAMLRREGQRVLVLGDAGQVLDDEPVVYFDTSANRRPSVMAALGSAGPFEGIDYRHQPVLAAARTVPGTEWRVLAKKDLSEIDGPLLRPLWAIFGLVGAILVILAAALASWWRGERERVRAEQEVREARDRLQLALAGVHFAWEWDLEAGRLTMERSWADRIGRLEHVYSGTVQEILARLVHPDDLPLVVTRLEAHVRGETPLFDSEHRTTGTAGGVRWILLRGRASRRDQAGRALLLSGVTSDVTERRALQAQLERSERMASLGTLAAGLAHEVNNPLSAVVANLEVLSRELAGDDRAELAALLAEARDGAERVQDVARSLKVFSRAGDDTRHPVDLREELAAAVRLTRNQMRHHARLEVHLGDLPLVDAGGHELGQVFLNLLANAAQAIPEGSADANLVAVETSTDGDGWAVVEVRDSGPGIRPELLPRIFEPFFTTKVDGVGTGLGLAIVHSIVTAAGGQVTVESQVGHGSTFRVRLPPSQGGRAAEPAPPAPAPVSPAGPEAPGVLAPPRPAEVSAGAEWVVPRLLVVDDDPLVGRSIVRSLGRTYRVELAGAAREALARIEAGERYDAILSDLMMPEMTGMELHARLAAIAPAQAARMIFITGGAFTPAAEAFLYAMPHQALEKPFDLSLVRAAVARVMGEAAGPPAPGPG
jgi:signal transduction histidine kinase/ActR/RegA family two-component response regulator